MNPDPTRLRPWTTIAVTLALLTAGCVAGPLDDDEDLAPDATTEPADQTQDVRSGDEGNSSQHAGDAGTSSPNATRGGDPDASGSNASSTEPAEPGPRTIQHAMGETTIDGRTERVVALEFNHVENLLALGLQPVGVADKDGYEKWVDAGIGLDDSVEDVGTRQEPSLERIAALEPDLIVAVEFRHADIYDELSSIAPTLVFETFPENDSEDNQYTRMKSIFNRTADAILRAEEADRVLQDLADHLRQTRAWVDDHGKEGREILVAQVFTHQDTPLLRVFTDNSIPIQIAHHLGLENAWTRSECSQGYGFCTVGKEGLAHVQHADFFYQAQPDDNPVEDEWEHDPVWNSYEFVQEDRVYPLGAETWLFGGPLISQKIADRIVDHYRGGR